MAEKELLSAPTATDERFEKPLTRSSCPYEDLSKKFRIEHEKRDYKPQYAQIYYFRLMTMAPLVRAAAEKKWGSDCPPFKELVKLKPGERCYVVGTLFKKMDLKPSILKEISATHHLNPQPQRENYVGVNDKLILEDTMQRVTLTGNIPSDELVTGIVVAVMGREDRNCVLEVEDYCFAGLPSQEEMSAMETDEEERYVVLVSGLNLGSSWCDQLSVQLLTDYITGQLAGPLDHEFNSNIVRVIIAGNSITDKPAKASTTKDTKTQYLSRNYTADSIDAVREVDDMLVQLASCVPVDLMPGSHDPTTHQFPQQPLHKCMFPQASRLPTLKGVTNPYQASIGGVLFLGCSGQNVDDISMYSTLTDRLQILENTLHWRHLVPTAPDTLGCYPYFNEDPFIIDKCPHVYFSGNQHQFQHKKIRGEEGQTVLLINVPSFDLTHSCVLVNLSTLECEELVFSSSLQHRPNPELERLAQSLQQTPGQTPEAEMTLLHHMDLDDEDD